jgi:excisionase family DNA binding protein
MKSNDLGIPNLIREDEAARVLQISQRNLIRLRNKGMVPYYRIGKSIRYSRDKLLAALEVAPEVG